jgi:hypothetical protein
MRHRFQNLYQCSYMPMLSCFLLVLKQTRCLIIEPEQRLHRRYILPHDVLLHVPRKLLSVVLRKLFVPHVEHRVQFLQREVLGLGQQEVAVYPAEEVPRGIPREGTLG